jgi:hypothetical protein
VWSGTRIGGWLREALGQAVPAFETELVGDDAPRVGQGERDRGIARRFTPALPHNAPQPFEIFGVAQPLVEPPERGCVPAVGSDQVAGEGLECHDSLRMQGFDVVKELRPAFEAILAGKDELRVSEHRLDNARLVDPRTLHGSRIAATPGAQQVFRLLSQLLE